MMDDDRQKALGGFFGGRCADRTRSRSIVDAIVGGRLPDDACSARPPRSSTQKRFKRLTKEVKGREGRRKCQREPWQTVGWTDPLEPTVGCLTTRSTRLVTGEGKMPARCPSIDIIRNNAHPSIHSLYFFLF
jgi:hypothetical protein